MNTKRQVNLGISALAGLALAGTLHAQQLTVGNVSFQQRTDGSKKVDISYTVGGGTAPYHVSVQVSNDGGATYAVAATSFTGAVGANQTAGTAKVITWDAAADWAGNYSATMRFRVNATDSEPPPDGFALIPAGPFQMGDQSSPLVGYSDERPVHTVQVSAFYLGKYEVTKEDWDAVRTWGLANGYTDLPAGNGSYASKGANHPVHSIDWYAMVKWCNARSQKDGLTPCYTVSGATYKTGSSDAVACNWAANGYRLPTEAEWEKATRGGVAGKNFPWGTDTITHSQANYCVYSSNGTTNYYAYDLTPRPGYSTTAYYHPTYAVGGSPYSSPVGSFAPNGYGLYDMAGNMWEWCWDWFGSYAAGWQTDPRGPATGSYRVFRGGCWLSDSDRARCALRNYNYPTYADDFNGFRLARGQP
ncbi:MAG: SUMF1/EgtB/PvdO family nonheme iron enzyme [Verrucomicrobia bacterium]|nr:SUMF1/EgtB/PvdO family nonheme iron enzyme [Verrucomicrobiota bacterium]